jgi:lipid-binding SYLF domain-containing protein
MSNKIQLIKRLVLAGLLLSAATLTSVLPAQAQMACQIRLEITKGGFIIGAAGGSGVLICGGERYPLSVGGMSIGLVIGMAKVSLVGEVRNLRQVSDIEGTYSGVGASIAVGGGADNVVAANANGVQLVMRGTQVGLEASLDLSGATIRLK